MTLTRALNEVKLLEKRINKYNSDDATWVAVSKNGKIGTNTDVNILSSIAKENKQSLTDLIKRRNSIKHKILNANNSTTIKVANEEYTIAEAIDMKNFIETERDVYRTIKMQIHRTEREYIIKCEEVDNLVERTVSQTLQSDGKKDASMVAGIEKYVRDNNKIVLEDPAHITKWVDERLEYVENFINEIDFSLSEINAITKIEV